MANELDILFNKSKDIATELGSKTPKGLRVAGKGALEYAPFIGDVYDISRGTYQAFHGHPFIGTGQAVMGLGGLAANLLAPGSGTLAKAGIKAGGKALIKAGGKQLAKKAVATTAKRASHPIANSLGRPLIPEVLYAMSGDTNKEVQQPVNVQKEQVVNNSLQQNKPVQNQLPPQAAGFDSIENLILGKLANGEGYDNSLNNQSLPDIQSITGNNNATIDSDGNVTSDNPNINLLLERYKRQQELQKPYIEGLENLINNYDKLKQNAFNTDRYFTGLAGYTGNQNWTKFADKYNPITSEATKLDLLNKLAQGQIGIDDVTNELTGNIALAKEAGISPEIAMANPKLVNALASITNARTAAEARRYVADANKDARLTNTYANAMVQKAKIEGNWALALQLQEMKNDGRLQAAIVNAVSFGADPATIYSVLEGYNNPQLNNQVPNSLSSNEGGLAGSLIQNYKR